MISRLTFLTLLVCVFVGQNSFSQEKAEIDTTEIWHAVDVMPVFPGNEPALFKFISSNLKYPEEAKTKNIKGTVFIEFVIDTVGNVRPETVKVKKSLHPLLDDEAIRVVKLLPQWKPGFITILNKPAEVNYVLPFQFK
ncbi:MAG: energy transducer TonB [Bacteroidetes bacterium]|nr:energy transducer TonB [Bacteroidota bacterium]HET6243777.1 energy transducer TonB [Bacteroidia bacterium]